MRTVGGEQRQAPAQSAQLSQVSDHEAENVEFRITKPKTWSFGSRSRKRGVSDHEAENVEFRITEPKTWSFGSRSRTQFSDFFWGGVEKFTTRAQYDT